MKKGIVVLITFTLFAGLAFSQSAQQTQKSVEAFMIDKFDSEGESGWNWEVSASRYVAEGFPKQGYFEGMPSSLKYLQKPGEGENPQVLGVQIAFNRKGDNWFEVYPTKDGEPYEVPLLGTVTQLDFWVWGAHYMYFIDILLRDADGRVQVIPAGNLAFDGWKNKVIKVPGWIRQHSRLSTGAETMHFLGFRIRTSPEEYVDQFTIFFDQFKYLTNALAYIFDGYELKDAEFGESESGESNANSNADTNEGK